MLTFAACAPGPAEPEASKGTAQSPAATRAAIREGTWTRIPPAPFGWYRPEGAFWIDGRLVVVARSTILSWDPESREWRTIVDVPQADECEGCGYSESVVWTGEDLLLWGGGFAYLAPDGTAHAGAAVDLDGNMTPLPQAPIRVRWWHDAVWTGTEMIVFGGGRDSHGRRDGAAYDPATREWRVIARAPVGGYANSLVWTGEEMITWGGIRDSRTGIHGYPTGFVARGAAYSPATDTWRTLETSGLDARGWHTAVWTGREMIVWGGVSEPQTTCYDCGYAGDAGAYDPVSRTWREVDPGPLPGRVEHTAVWTGTEMIVFGGGTPGGGAGRDDGAAYHPVTDAWRVLPPPPIRGRYRHAAVWTGDEMVVWGGLTNATGAAFTPDA